MHNFLAAVRGKVLACSGYDLVKLLRCLGDLGYKPARPFLAEVAAAIEVRRAGGVLILQGVLRMMGLPWFWVVFRVFYVLLQLLVLLPLAVPCEAAASDCCPADVCSQRTPSGAGVPVVGIAVGMWWASGVVDAILGGWGACCW
jgi:hypothetical protein